MEDNEVSAAIDNNAKRLIAWQFEKHDLNREVQSPVEGVEGVIQEEVDEDPKKLDIPASWQPDYKKSERPPAAAQPAVHVDPLAVLLNGDDDSAMPSQFLESGNIIRNTAWDIIFSIRHLLPGVWHRRLQDIILQTAEIGVKLQAEEIDVTGIKGEALWRYKAYRATHCPIDGERMSRPAQPFGGIEQ
jgi:hypothetical protein